MLINPTRPTSPPPPDTRHWSPASAASSSADACATGARSGIAVVAERTVASVVSEVRFGVTYGGLNERFWSHIDSLLSLCQIVLGMLAVAGAFSDPSAIKVAGVGLALVSGVQLALAPRKRSVEFRDARIRFHELLGRAGSMDLAQLVADLERIKAADAPGMRVFYKPAWNIEAEALGEQERYSLTWAEAIALRLAW